MDKEQYKAFYESVYRHSLAHILAKAVIEIYGADKVQYAIDTFGDTPEKAAKRVKHVDASRQSFYHYLTSEKWGDLTKYDITVNSSPIGKQACADVIIAYAKAKEAKENQ